MADKKNLVIVRAGDDSLHEGWINNARNWDIIISCFGEQPQKWQRDDAIHIIYQGGKFDGIYDAFQQRPGLLDKYDYIMMADDDFAMTAEDINRTFDIMRKHDLQIGQPSLSHKSYSIHFSPYHNSRFKLRFTNFAETRAVCLSTHIFQQVLPLYENNPMALSIDYLSTRLTDNPQRQTAIIDEVQITKTQPYQKNSDHIKKFGWTEKSAVQFTLPGYHEDLGKWQLPKIVCHAAILSDDQRVDRENLLPILASEWIKTAENISDWQMFLYRPKWECLALAIDNQMEVQEDLSKTKIIIFGHKDRIRENNLLKLQNSNKKNLLIVRAGDDSWHEEWMQDERNWDILVSCFGDHPKKWLRDDVMHIFYKGGKFDGLHDAFEQVPGLMDKYEYIMMADDDFMMTTEDINRIFDISRKYDLQLSMPSQLHESHIIYFTTLHNPAFEVRLTNFVEAGVVCMTPSIWKKVLPLWKEAPHALGIDFFWTRLTDDPTCQAGIIDSIQVGHILSRKGTLHQKFQKVQTIKYTVKGYTPPKIQLPMVCHGGWTKKGKKMKGRWIALLFLCLGWMKMAAKLDKNKFGNGKSVAHNIRRAMKEQIFSKGDLSKLEIITDEPYQPS